MLKVIFTEGLLLLKTFIQNRKFLHKKVNWSLNYLLPMFPSISILTSTLRQMKKSKNAAE